MTLRRAEAGLLALILGLTAIKGLLWSIAIPLWQGPDENRHYAVVQFIAERRRLPGVEDVYHDDEGIIASELSEVSRLWYYPGFRQTFGPGAHGPNEAAIAALDPSLRTSTERETVTLAMHLPPLYYLMGVLFYLPVRGGDVLQRAFAVRQLSVALGTFTVWCAYAIARQIFPRRRAMWFTVPVLVSFQPMFTFVTSVVNTDALLIAILSGLIYLLIRVLKTRLTPGLAIGIGALMGAGLLTKPFVVAMLPPLAVVTGWELVRGKGRRRHIALALSLLVVSLAAVWGGWVLRSARLGNNPFYANPLLYGRLELENPFYDYRIGRYIVDYVISLVGGTWVSFWADFGWIETPMDRGYYVALYGIVALAVVGALIDLLHRCRRRAFDLQTGLLVFTGLCGAALVGTLGASNFYSWRARGVGAGIQGRYYLGAIVPLAISLAFGLLVFVPERWRPAGHLVLGWGMIVLNLVCLFQVILPRYYM
jgi:4-amino-4-deoxy-L-arabinose transferase-like glycosyltransferase